MQLEMQRCSISRAEIGEIKITQQRDRDRADANTNWNGSAQNVNTQSSTPYWSEATIQKKIMEQFHLYLQIRGGIGS